MDKKIERRRQFTLQEKLVIIEKVDGGVKKNHIAKEFGIAPSTISTILKDRYKIQDKIKERALGPQRKKMRSGLHDHIDKATFLWLQDVRSKNIPITGTMIRGKALDFARQLNVDHFQASVGWLNRFKERYGITLKAVSEEYTPHEWRTDEIKRSIIEYDKKDIFNAVETCLFYQLFPNRLSGFKEDPCKDGEKSKHRLTILFCCNATGTEKMKPLVIGKYASPRCLKNVRSLPCDYSANSRAWMTQQLFNEWLKNLDTQMERQHRKILLLIDNCSAHNLTCKLQNVKVEILPPNCTSVLQPLNTGIIRATKMYYRNMLLKKLLFNLVSEEDKEIDIKEACYMVCTSWWAVKESTVSKCWRKSDIFEYYEEETNMTDVDTDEVEIEGREMWSSMVDNPDITYDEYIDVDCNVVIASEFNDKEIIKILRPCTSDSTLTMESEGDDEENEINSSKVSLSDAVDGLQKVRDYLFGCYDIPEEIFKNISNIENIIMNT